ncbi:uncharacterized protein DSM5745_01263 [Aspergillus mulundensis]|uniref:DUF7730 domain-containing protein n=1 Tax=Aspergillus mulundensis TaxID=1810919 RepID=A0A3D8T680_9EURO|nr:Uncharacterized protein DSM5745_01263 [Aspergillus mulundensis]RDW93941.1 Uncharacterized protein DSM5745_01263 [Aspergillus mulundensis]
MARIKQGVFSWEDVIAHRYQNNKPPAIPRPRRQSALSTSTSTAPETDPRISWDIQPQSALLSNLSPELRVMIWEAVLGGMRIHIIQRSDKRMGHVVCPALEPDAEPCDICRGGLPPSSSASSSRSRRSSSGSDSSGGREGSGSRSPHLQNKTHLLALPTTSKQIYTESIHLIYTLNTFEFSNTWSLTYLRPTVPADLWDSIRTVELAWAFPGHWLPSKDPVKSVYFSAGRTQWLETCAAITRMKGLQDFTLQLSGAWFCESVEKLPVFLEPLRGLRLVGRKKWVVVLPNQPVYVQDVRSGFVDGVLGKRGVECRVLVGC